MSTRSTTHFCHDDGSTVAIVYRHSDGYPGVAGADLFRFLNEVNDNVKDKRFSDPTYLAAKYVVWLAHEFNNEYDTDKGWRPAASSFCRSVSCRRIRWISNTSIASSATA